MNVFLLDHDHKLAARWHFNVHMNALPLEACQLMSNAHHARRGRAPMGIREPWHPWSKWTGLSRDNYCFLVDHTHALMMERKRRGMKVDGRLAELFGWLSVNHPDTLSSDLTPFPLTLNGRIIECAPSTLITHDTINKYTTFHPDACDVLEETMKAYRRYYRLEKARLMGKKDALPPWWSEATSLTPSLFSGM